MQKVKVLPELYLSDIGLYYVISECGTVYGTTDGEKHYFRSIHRADVFRWGKYPVANIRMRWVHVDV